MLDYLNRLDHSLFLAIHHWRNPFLDALMPVVTNRWTWIPLYILLAVLLSLRFRRQMLILAPVIALLILCSDQSANLLKNNICRPRPCYDASLENVITPDGCGGNYGFVSGHAANSMALAVFLWLLAGPARGFSPVKRKKAWLLLFPWVILVCWSRIYMGVHFPFDLLGGCLLGMCWAFLIFILYRNFAPVLK
jgi:undecaprenyl-diphosphatase